MASHVSIETFETSCGRGTFGSVSLSWAWSQPMVSTGATICARIRLMVSYVSCQRAGAGCGVSSAVGIGFGFRGDAVDRFRFGGSGVALDEAASSSSTLDAFNDFVRRAFLGVASALEAASVIASLSGGIVLEPGSDFILFERRTVVASSVAS